MSYESNYLQSFSKLIEGVITAIDNNELSLEQWMENISSLTKKIQADGGRLFFVGNGASAAFCNHMALDWSKNGNVNSYVLSDSALLTALANDYDYNSAFIEYLKIEKATSNDLVITISSSGNSGNIQNTIDFCKENKINVLSMSGLKPDNYSRRNANYSLYVPAKTYGMVECAHQLFMHMWLDKFMDIYEWDRSVFQDMNNDNFTL